MKRYAWCWVAVFAMACSEAHDPSDGGSDAGHMDATVQVDAGPDARVPVDARVGRDAGELTDAGPVVCGGSECPPGFACCIRNGLCYDPGDPGVCFGIPDDASIPGLDGSIIPGPDGGIVPPMTCIEPCMRPMMCCLTRGICCSPGDTACCPRLP